MRRVVLIGAALSALTSSCILFSSEPERSYPTWKVARAAPARLTSCASADAWVSRSGREGVGVTLELRASASEPAGSVCPVRVKSMEFRIEGVSVAPDRLPPSPALSPGGAVRAYVGFGFDNLADVRRAELIVYADDGASGPPTRARFELVQVMDSPGSPSP